MYLNTAEKWRAILTKVEAGIRKIFPIEGKTGKIECLRVEIPNKTEATISAQKSKLLGGSTLGTPVYAELRLTRKNGKSETAKIKILDLPILTDRGTFIVQGKDYSVFNQVRLLPGVYTRHTNDSAAVFSDFNLGRGLGFEIHMNNEGVFFIKFDKSKLSSSSKKIPLYPLIIALGATDGEVKRYWGEKSLEVNKAKSSPDDLNKIIEQVIYPTKRTGNVVKDLRDYFATNQLNPNTTKVTLGRPISGVDARVLLEASAKLVRVYNNKEDEDDLDSLLFKEVLSVEDHIMLRIEKKSKEEGLIYKVMNKIDQGYPLKSIILPNFLTKLVEGLFTKSSLSAPQTEINPIEILETNHKLTAMGEGGIGSERAIPMDARNLHPSHLGYIDPVRTTESGRVGIDLRTTSNAVIKDRNVYTEFIDRNGKKVMLKPLDLADKVVGFPGQEGKNMVRVLYNNKMKEVPRNKVDYWMPKASNMFTITTNLVPFLHNDQGNRVTMAGRMVTQAVPLVHREAPLVQIRDSSGKYETIQEKYGKDFFVPRSPIDGTVTEVTKEYIKINNQKVEIYHNFPLNLKCPSGEMRVVIKRATGSIWEGKIKDYHYVKDDFIQSINPETCEPSWEYINAFDKQVNDKVLYRIEFKSGRSVIVTEDHSLITLNTMGDLVPIFPKDCTVGKTQCPITMVPPVVNRVGLPYDDYKYGLLVGLVLASGQLTVNAVKIYAPDKDISVEVMCLLSMLDIQRIPEYDGKYATLVSPQLVTWLKGLCIWDTPPRLSPIVYNYSDSFRKGIIAGLFSGDAKITSTKKTCSIVYRTTHEELHNDVANILSSLNVMYEVSRTNAYVVRNQRRRGYNIKISAPHIPDWPMFYYSVMENKLGEVLRTIKNVQSKFRLAPAMLNKLPDHAKNLWEKSRVYWDTIVDIDEVPHEDFVYDFEVARSNMFAVSNGLVIHNTFLTMYPLVKVGDKVKKGDILADSNFTKNGELALGTNLNVAYVPYKGWTHEDSIVISESAAEKLTSQHMYIKEFESSPEAFLDKAGFIKWFPTKITIENIKKLDDSGVVRKGEIVKRGDVLITGLRKKTLTGADNMMRRLRGSLVNPYKDASEVWDHDTPGTVADVVRQGRLIRVVVTTEDKAKQGDKLSGLHGNKGTIGLILPDDEMPVDSKGRRLDAMLNPASVPSRVNPGQLYEAMEGKRALERGRKVVIDNFDPADSSQKVLAKMKRDNIAVEEDVYDPKTGKSLGKVLVGTPYFIKLHKQTEGNFSGLYRGAYDINNQPIKGGEEGAKGVGQLDVYALLGHNARNNLAEMATYKSDRNDDFWNRLEAGLTPAPAKEPFAFNKFKSLVTASGIGVTADNQNLTIAPLTDKEILNLSKGAIQRGAILENHMGKDRPEKGGIFDPIVTGGLKGQNWSHINLAAPIVNPLFEGVVSTLLHKDITGMNGKDVQKELAAINVSKRIGEISAQLKSATGSTRNKLLKELKYLTALKKSGTSPADYVLTKFPIIPPQFRPVYDSQTGGLPMVSDVNYLYKDMLNVNEKLDAMKDYPDSEKGALLKDLRQSAHAIIGLMAPVNKQNEKRGVTGFLPQLTGSNYSGQGTSKESFFHRKILKRQQTLTGRGTILPDPDLNVDNVKIPWDMAWKIYMPFVLAEFKKRGINIIKAKEEIKNRTQVAKQILVSQMEKRPVLMNRAPTLHKYNIMAFKPIPTEGKSLYIPPLVIKGFAADFDGDSVSGETTVCVRNKEGRIKVTKIKNVPAI